MIRRPLDRCFRQKVLDMVKVTTIRDQAWPLGVPIMLYHWTGKPYRSKQEDFVPVMVEVSSPMVIMRTRRHGALSYMSESRLVELPLWVTEGFDSESAMHDWFRKIVPVGGVAKKNIMRFRLWEGSRG